MTTENFIIGHSHAMIAGPCPVCGGPQEGAFGFGNNKNINKVEFPFIAVHSQCGAAIMFTSPSECHEVTREEWRNMDRLTQNRIGLAQIACHRTNKLRGGPPA